MKRKKKKNRINVQKIAENSTDFEKLAFFGESYFHNKEALIKSVLRSREHRIIINYMLSTSARLYCNQNAHKLARKKKQQGNYMSKVNVHTFLHSNSLIQVMMRGVSMKLGVIEIAIKCSTYCKQI